MRRIVCICIIFITIISCINIIKVLNDNNDLYDDLTQQELKYDKLRDNKVAELELIKSENKDKVLELEKYKEWDKQIVDYMQ